MRIASGKLGQAATTEAELETKRGRPLFLPPTSRRGLVGAHGGTGRTLRCRHWNLTPAVVKRSSGESSQSHRSRPPRAPEAALPPRCQTDRRPWSGSGQFRAPSRGC